MHERQMAIMHHMHFMHYMHDMHGGTYLKSRREKGREREDEESYCNRRAKKLFWYKKLFCNHLQIYQYKLFSFLLFL